MLLLPPSDPSIMPKSNWTKEQQQLIVKNVPKWKEDKDKVRRNTVLEEMYTELGGGDGTSLTEAQKKVSRHPEVPDEAYAFGYQSAKRMLQENARTVEEEPEENQQWGRTWTVASVARELYPERFHDVMRELAPDHAPGTSEYLAQFNPGLKKLVDEELTQEERDDCAAKKKTWNTASPPHHIQMKYLEKDGDKAFQRFTAEMFRSYGVRLVMLGTFLDKDETVSQFMSVQCTLETCPCTCLHSRNQTAWTTIRNSEGARRSRMWYRSGKSIQSGG